MSSASRLLQTAKSPGNKLPGLFSIPKSQPSTDGTHCDVVMLYMCYERASPRSKVREMARDKASN